MYLLILLQQLARPILPKNLHLKGINPTPAPTNLAVPLSIILHSTGDFVDNFFIGDVTFDGGLTNEEQGCTDE